MNNEVPKLILEPFSEEASAKEEIYGEIAKEESNQIEKPLFDDSTLTPQEKKMIDDFVNQIDLTKSNQILQSPH
jgi:transcriptional regulator CtsR